MERQLRSGDAAQDHGRGNGAAGRKVRMGMIGGGEGAFIGPVHRMAAELDGEIELVCGAFSNPSRMTREAR